MSERGETGGDERESVLTVYYIVRRERDVHESMIAMAIQSGTIDKNVRTSCVLASFHVISLFYTYSYYIHPFINIFNCPPSATIINSLSLSCSRVLLVWIWKMT